MPQQNHKKRVLELNRAQGNSFVAEVNVPRLMSLKFADMTADFNPLVRRGVVPGFYIDSVVASAFEDAVAGSRVHPPIVSISSKFIKYFMAGEPVKFAFSPSRLTSAELQTVKEGKQVCSVKIGYGEPVQSHTSPESFGGMQGLIEYSFSEADVENFRRMTGAIPKARHLVPMLALSYFSSAAEMALPKNKGYAEPAVRFSEAGPLEVWGYTLGSKKQDGEPAQDDLERISAIAGECFEKGGIVYTSHTVTFFQGAYQLVPSERFMIYIDYSGLRPLKSEDGKNIVGVRGSVKGEAVLSNNERIFECSAGVYARSDW